MLIVSETRYQQPTFPGIRADHWGDLSTRLKERTLPTCCLVGPRETDKRELRASATAVQQYDNHKNCDCCLQTYMPYMAETITFTQRRVTSVHPLSSAPGGMGPIAPARAPEHQVPRRRRQQQPLNGRAPGSDLRYSTSKPRHHRLQHWPPFLLRGEERPVGAGSHGRGADGAAAPLQLFSRNAAENFSGAERRPIL